MNKLTDFQRRMIVLGIGALMILLGVVQAIWKPALLINNKKVIDEVTFILMLLAAVLLFSKKKPKAEPEKKEAEEGPSEPAKLEEQTPDGQK
ncbi:MAG TPA: hypothetical protein DDW65_20730 [Firmicutes bacterium]|jgi:hypothetical protein|nr:hypothetical protein [Bacillota bacterium]